MNGTLSVEMITVDCADPERLVRWWSSALGGQIVPVVPGEFVILDHGRGPRLGFQRVEEPTPGKAKIHLDFSTPDMEGEVRRLVDLGASETGRHAFGDFGWVVLEDPDGNVFCVAPVMG